MPTTLAVVSPPEMEEARGAYEDAVSRYGTKDYDGAVIQLKNVLQANPQHLPARLLMGRAQLQQGFPSAAEKELRIALRLGAARDKVYPYLGNALLIQRKYQEILDTLSTPHSRTPEAEQVYLFHGRAYLGLRLLDEAEQSFEQAARLSPNGLEELLGTAAVWAARGNLAQTESWVDRALQHHPGNKDAWFEKARLRAEQGDTDGAFKNYARALELYPDSYKTLVARAALYLRVNQPEKALRDLERVYDNVPADLNARFLYAQALLRTGSTVEAEVILDEMQVFVSRISETTLHEQPGFLRTATLINYLSGELEQANTYGSRYMRQHPHDVEMGKLVSSICLDLGRDALAIELLEQVSRYSPNDPAVLQLLGEAHIRRFRFGEATRLLEQAAALAPDDAGIGISLGLGKFAQGLSEEGETELMRAFELNSRKSISAGFILTQVQLRRGETETALITVRKLISRQRGNPMLYNLLGAVYLELEDPDKARKAFETASAVSPGFLGSEYNLALLDIHEEQFADAKARLDRLVEQHPQSVLVLAALADLSEAVGDQQRAIQWLIKAAALEHDSIEPGVRLVDLFILNQQFEDALRQGDNNARLYPRDPESIASLARAQMVNNLNREARASLRKAVALVEFDADINLLPLADQQTRLEDYAGAHNTLIKATNTDQAPEAEAALIRLSLITGELAAAEGALARLQKLTDNTAVIDLFTGDIRLQQGRYQEALDAYQESHTKSPASLSSLGIFRSLLKLGQQDKAQQWLVNWCDSHPEDVVSRRTLARSLLSSGNQSEAQAHYELLLEEEQGISEDYSFLARIYQLDKDSRALTMAETALVLDRGSPRALDTYGWILVTEGRAAEGLPYLREAVSRNSDLFLRYHLASALNEVGRTDEARRELHAILQTQKQLPWLTSAQALYDSLPEEQEPIAE